MDVKQMTYILTIAQEGGISKAAAKLFITQSALDQQLLKLEHELGTRLFFRSRSSFALTEAGRVYVDYARRMLELKNEAYRIIHDIAGRRRGTLSLAFAPDNQEYLKNTRHPDKHGALTAPPRLRSRFLIKKG